MKEALIRLAVYTLGIVGVAALAVVFFVYSISRAGVRTAYQMMGDASQLEIGVSSLSDALAFARKYRAEVSGSSRNDPCLESDCLVWADPQTNDFWSRHPKLTYSVDRILRRGWSFSILMWVKNGKLNAIEEWFGYSTARANSFVIATVSRPGRGLCGNPSYRLHHAFATYPGPKHFSVWVNAAATREKELLELNPKCVLRMSGCKGIADMAPAAWKEYEADLPLIAANESKRPDEIAADPECR